MPERFSEGDWTKIRAEFDQNAALYGLPPRREGSMLMASFNIREMGSEANRTTAEWEFLADMLRPFDFIAIQEVGDDLSGLRRIKRLLGDKYAIVVSDVTGVYPGVPGNPERLAFVYNWEVVERREVASDITFDRTSVLNLLADNLDNFRKELKDYAKQRQRHFKEPGKIKAPDLTKVKLPVFLTFIRQPHCVAFEIKGAEGSDPISFIAVNAHLYYGTGTQTPRRQEIGALIEWIRARLRESEHVYAPNFILLGDLNFDHNSEDDRKWSDNFLKAYNVAAGDEGRVNFPFLDRHRTQEGLLHDGEVFRTNARLNQTYDQIGLFGPDGWVWNFDQNETLPVHSLGPDYGMFNFEELFAQALFSQRFHELSEPDRDSIWERSEHKVSDHMPIWIRLPLPV